MSFLNIDNCCAICFCDEIEKPKHVLECGHTFHTDCILSWFRASKNPDCPLCRNDGDWNIPDLRYKDKVKFLEMFSKNKNCPEDICEILNKYKCKKEHLKQKSREVRDVKTQINKTNLWKIYKRKLRNEQRAYEKLFELKRMINCIDVKPLIKKQD